MRLQLEIPVWESKPSSLVNLAIQTSDPPNLLDNSRNPRFAPNQKRREHSTGANQPGDSVARSRLLHDDLCLAKREWCSARSGTLAETRNQRRATSQSQLERGRYVGAVGA